MKITIDTQVDSHEDIQKAIQLLGHFVGSTSSVVTSVSKEEVDPTSMMNMFADSQPAATPAKKVPDTPPDFSSFLNLTKKDEDKDDEPQVELF